MNQPPWSDIGSLQSEVRELRNSINIKSDKHEIHEINRRLDSMEHSLREISSETSGFSFRLQKMEETIREMNTLTKEEEVKQ